MESGYTDANGDPGVLRGRAFLLRSTTRRGIDTAPPNGVAAVAGLRALGFSTLAGS